MDPVCQLHSVPHCMAEEIPVIVGRHRKKLSLCSKADKSSPAEIFTQEVTCSSGAGLEDTEQRPDEISKEPSGRFGCNDLFLLQLCGALFK